MSKVQRNRYIYLGVGAGAGFLGGFALKKFLPNTIVPYIPDWNGIGINKIENFFPLASAIITLIAGYQTENKNTKFACYGYTLGALSWAGHNMSQTTSAQARMRAMQQSRVMSNRAHPIIPVRPVNAVVPNPVNNLMRNGGNGKTIKGRSQGYTTGSTTTCAISNHSASLSLPTNPNANIHSSPQNYGEIIS